MCHIEMSVACIRQLPIRRLLCGTEKLIYAETFNGFCGMYVLLATWVCARPPRRRLPRLTMTPKLSVWWKGRRQARGKKISQLIAKYHELSPID